MRRFVNSLVYLLLIQSSLLGQKFSSPSLALSDDYKRLWYLNTQYIQAWIHSDTGLYNRLLWADDFVHQSGSNGLLYPKSEISKLFGNKRFDQINWFYPDDTKIVFINDHAAMVFSRPPYFGKQDTIESFSQYNDIYIKRGGNWVCVSANITNCSGLNTIPATLSKIPQASIFLSIVQGTETEKEEILHRQKEARVLLQSGNYKRALQLLDNKFIMLTPEGNLLPKKLLTKKLSKNGLLGFGSFRLVNLAVRFVATDIAMVHGAMVFDSQKLPTTGIQFNDIFVKRDLEWLLVSSNNTPIRN